MTAKIPHEIAEAFGVASRAQREIHSNINTTLIVERTGDATQAVQVVLQRLHTVFGASVNDDMALVTDHLASHGLPTPRLIRTRDGATHAVDAEGRVWRLQTFMAGHCYARAGGPAQVSSAGQLLAKFHRALLDLATPLAHSRPIHDTAAHLKHLRIVLAGDRAHQDSEAQALGAAVLEHADAVRLDFLGLPRALRHGDPKLSNLLFEPNQPNRALCMIDLDTVSIAPLAYELGDALRSWCNPCGEDDTRSEVDTELLRSALSGYLVGCASQQGLPDLSVSTAELVSALDGLETICTELASRFAADVVEDRYWGWDRQRFGSRREHNALRARSQLNLARSVRNLRPQLLAVVRSLRPQLSS